MTFNPITFFVLLPLFTANFVGNDATAADSTKDQIDSVTRPSLCTISQRLRGKC